MSINLLAELDERESAVLAVLQAAGRSPRFPGVHVVFMFAKHPFHFALPGLNDSSRINYALVAAA